NVVLDRVDRLLTTRGTGALNLNAAPVEVLATVPGLSPEALAVVERRRNERRLLSSADELASLLSSRGRHELYRTYQDFLRAVSFSPGKPVAHIEGWIERSPARARMTVTLVPVGSRLAVVRREVQ
ncbi:MAG TPA: hypothetical protein VK845_14445, partial [Gemmatimonadales bacterium]|nr:hypothetical protein [Gemmatimonadales bacterium]